MKALVTHRFFKLFCCVLLLGGVMHAGFSTASAVQISDNPTGGECAYFGIWNAKTKTCTLTSDLSDPLEIVSSGVTLNGNGYAILGLPVEQGYTPGVGLLMNNVTEVTVTHVTIGNFDYAIYMSEVTNSRIVHNSLPNNHFGIQIDYSSRNDITANGLYMTGHGILLDSSEENMIIGNTIEGGCCAGIELRDASNSNIVLGNEVTVREEDGIRVGGSFNTMSGNIITGCMTVGIKIGYGADFNMAVNNVLTDNNEQVTDDGIGNTFTNNYYSEYDDCDDADSDGICDAPYQFFYGQDASALKAAPIETAAIQIIPTFLNAKTKTGTITAYIEVPGYSAGNILVESVRLVAAKGYVWTNDFPARTGDYNGNGIPDLRVKFRKEYIVSVLDPGANEVTIVGIIDGRTFEGKTSLNVR